MSQNIIDFYILKYKIGTSGDGIQNIPQTSWGYYDKKGQKCEYMRKKKQQHSSND